VPVKVDAGMWEITAPGSVPTDVIANATTIVPILIADRTSQITVREINRNQQTTLSLKPIPADEKLIAYTIAARAAANALFAGQPKSSIEITQADLLGPSPIKWECADALVLTLDDLSRLNDIARSALLSSGVTIAVQNDGVPDDRWPWVKQKDLWILSQTPIGLKDDVVSSNAYSPTYSWSTALSADAKKRIGIAAIFFTLLCVLVLLWPSKRRPIVLLIVCAISAGFIWLFRDALVPVPTRIVRITIDSPALAQTDTWLYERPMRSGVQTIPWDGWTRPILTSTEQIQNLQLNLCVQRDGATSFRFMAPDKQTLALLHRDVKPPDMASLAAINNAPPSDLLKDFYPLEGMTIESATSNDSALWYTARLTRATTQPSSN